MIIFESWSKFLLFLHFLAGIAVVGSAVHLTFRFSEGLLGKAGRTAKVCLHARTLMYSYLASMVLGAMLYPAFRVRVRHEYLDVEIPLATALFEIKEHLAALALFPIVLLYFMARVFKRAGAFESEYRVLFGGLLGFVLISLGYAGWCGWYLTTLRSL